MPILYLSFFLTLILAICFEINLIFFKIVNSYFLFEFSVLYRERIVNKNGICRENSSREKEKGQKKKRKAKEKEI
jgi:hypothetical protein